MSSTTGNRILGSLRQDDCDLLDSHFEPVKLKFRKQLETASLPEAELERLFPGRS